MWMIKLLCNLPISRTHYLLRVASHRGNCCLCESGKISADSHNKPALRDCFMKSLADLAVRFELHWPAFFSNIDGQFTNMRTLFRPLNCLLTCDKIKEECFPFI